MFVYLFIRRSRIFTASHFLVKFIPGLWKIYGADLKLRWCLIIIHSCLREDIYSFLLDLSMKPATPLIIERGKSTCRCLQGYSRHYATVFQCETARIWNAVTSRLQLYNNHLIKSNFFGVIVDVAPPLIRLLLTLLLLLLLSPLKQTLLILMLPLLLIITILLLLLGWW